MIFSQLLEPLNDKLSMNFCVFKTPSLKVCLIISINPHSFSSSVFIVASCSFSCLCSESKVEVIPFKISLIFFSFSPNGVSHSVSGYNLSISFLI